MIVSKNLMLVLENLKPNLIVEWRLLLNEFLKLYYGSSPKNEYIIDSSAVKFENEFLYE